MKAFRDYSPGDHLTVHTKGGTSVRGRFIRRSRLAVVLAKHSIEADGVYVESSMDHVCVPVENVALVEVRRA